VLVPPKPVRCGSALASGFQQGLHDLTEPQQVHNGHDYKSEEYQGSLFHVASPLLGVVMVMTADQRRLKNVENKPTTAHRAPPMMSQIDLSVGEPVKNCENCELTECEALTPQTINTIPTTRRARPRGLSMRDSFHSVARRIVLAERR
jgi:hypothetical protein